LGTRAATEYFYFAKSLLIAVIVVSDFSRTVNHNLFHPLDSRSHLHSPSPQN
jgi:hypothetical protein